MQKDTEKEYFAYLDDLRDSGVTNMYGAGQYLIWEFGITKQEAREAVIAYMSQKQQDTQ